MGKAAPASIRTGYVAACGDPAGAVGSGHPDRRDADVPADAPPARRPRHGDRRPEASPAAVERIRQQLGLDRPILEQLLVWLANIARGDFGRSLVLNQGVLAAVAQRLPVTLSLTVVSLAITVPIGVALGVLAACWRQTWLDPAIMALALLGLSVPSFWVAILSMILFSVSLHWLPTTGYAPLASGFGPWIASLAQPAAILALFQIGFLARITRSAMLDVLDQDFIRTARAKGLRNGAPSCGTRCATR